ncbi:hypothetical protein BBJ28_00021771, partial [Nothophytophthora sp. Chile5]
MLTANREQRVSAATAAGNGSPAAGNEFLKMIAVDFSSLEPRFEEIFTRMAAIEARLALQDQRTLLVGDVSVTALRGEEGNGGTDVDDNSADAVAASETPETVVKSGEHVEGGGPDGSDRNGGDGSLSYLPPNCKAYGDELTLAQEIESLRAAQLRLKIDQEIANSSLAVELTKLRQELEQRPRLADLQDFRDEVMAASTAATKALQSEQQKLAQAMDSSLSER